MLPGLPVAAQTAGGTISGQLVNGTAGGASVSDVEISLETFTNGLSAGNITAKTQSDGSYKFENLVTGANVYRLFLTYQEVDYFSDNLSFGQSTALSQNITVYDSTDNIAVVTVDTAHTIIVPANGVLEFTIVYDFINNSDRAFIGTGDPMANGKKKTLTFNIPADAIQVEYGDGLLPEYVYPSHGGFIDTMAVLPGIKELVYAYKVPYTGGKYNFAQTMNYDAAWFNLLVSGSGLKVTSSQLEDQGPLDMGGGNTYVYFTGHNFTAGETVSATLTGSASSQMLIFVVAGAGVVVVAGGALAYWRMRKRSGAMPAAKVTREADDEQSLLLALARLDDDFAAGTISEAAYRSQRAATKARLVQLMSGKRG